VVLVGKKSAPISSTPTHGVSKPPDVAMTVDGTFSEILVTRPIAPKPEMENGTGPSRNRLLPSTSLCGLF